ncbi:hypothetical protein [Caulobacter sp. BP25]|uniref:hypothetical protein n=1 Tax=Caulobacter sp. BP25 TaxID=2048900 RepID=UPI000C12D4E0|nr:hypothetical protein [Caulobacter sp. BP25]PHY19797.1 hypothetical protein CSW59_09850 [Caulobacter sp. BP25]
MTAQRFVTAAAAIALMAGAASAQTTTGAAPAPQAPVAGSLVATDPTLTWVAPTTTIDMAADPIASPSAMSAPEAGVNASGVVPVSSQSPEAQALLKAGDPNVVSNGPIADTTANRAKYGAPMSNAGKRTTPKGN